jgi:MFS family permease
LSAGALGVALLTLDKPTRARKLGLALLLVLVFATHVFRYPFTLAAVFGAALLLHPVTGRVKELLLPALPSLLLFALWWLVRDPVPGQETARFALEWARLREVPELLFDDFFGPEENRLALRSFGLLGLVGCLSFLVTRLAARHTSERADSAFRNRAALAVAAIAAVYLAMFLVLPMSIGLWWYVYPREIVAALFMTLALAPDLPKDPRAKLALLSLCALGAAGQTRFVAENYRDFERQTADFREIVEFIPKAPRLGYMMLDLSGAAQRVSPYLHLPAWVQAEKGGWLSFHFVSWGQSPIRYREGSAAVPPPTPLRFEWMQGGFDLRTRGRFFDWFLVRSASSPDRRFAVDPSLRRVAVRGKFWLYRRDEAWQRRP